MSSQSNKSSLRQFLPERILTSSKAAHLTLTFSVVISRRSQDWIRTDHRWAIEEQTGITHIAVALLVTFHKLLFQLQAFLLSPYEKFCLHSLTQFVHSWTFVPFGLETSDRRKPTKCLSPRREAKLFTSLFLCFPVLSHKKHLINRARSVCMGESRPRSIAVTDLTVFGLYWRPRLRFSHTDLPLD